MLICDIVKDILTDGAESVINHITCRKFKTTFEDLMTEELEK